MKGHLFVISAPSGTGKTTVIKNLLKNHPDYVLSVSATTRSPRVGEVDGVDYHFINEPKFKKMIDANELAEWAKVYLYYYGTPKAPIDAWIKDGKKVILDIDVQGGKNIKKIYPEATLIFLLPPSKDELIKRLSDRGTNTGLDLQVRIKNADLEMAEKKHYEFHVVNDTLERAVKEIEDIIAKTK